jgi:acyl-CoA synthetase (AMP-forming)/AMP-acid ligase II
MAPSLSDLKTFTEVLRWRAEQRPDQRLYSFLPSGECEGPDQIHWTVGDLDVRARAIAAELQSRGLQGERVLLIFQMGLDYIAAFFGCLYAGVLAVPVAPPDPNRLSKAWPQLTAIAGASGAAAILTSRSLQDLLSLSAREAPELGHLPRMVSDQIPLESAERWRPPAIDENSTAFLLYTSGSTGTPKGVMISHRNLISNSAAMHAASAADPADVYVSWIPHFHTMGILGGILQPPYGGLSGVLMSPTSFLQRPLRWIEAISYFKGSISPCPNFALDLCARRFLAEPSAKALDLRAWRIAGNGAEHIRAESLDLFTKTFEPYGFRREALYPGYGLGGGDVHGLGRIRFGTSRGEKIRKGGALKKPGRRGSRRGRENHGRMWEDHPRTDHRHRRCRIPPPLPIRRDR